MPCFTRGLVLFVALATASCSSSAEQKAKHLARGDEYFKSEDYREAIIEYRNAVSLDASDGAARLKLGGAYEAARDGRNALREYVRAADLLPKDLNAQLHAGRALLGSGQFPEAKARATAALAIDPKNSTGLILLGNSLVGLKDLDGAIEQIEEADKEGDLSTFAYTNLGYLQILKGNAAAAEAALKRAIEVDPKSVPAHLSLANFHWAAGRRDEAERTLKKAIEVEPNSEAANRAMAAFLITNGRSVEAEPYLKAYAQKLGPKLLLADYYIGQRRIGNAVAVLEPLAKTPDGFAPATLRLALIDFVSNRREQAYRTVEEILKRDAANQLALQTKARFLINERKFAEALKIAGEIVERYPRAPLAHYMRGATLLATGATDEALAAFQEALHLAPASMIAKIEMAQIHLARRNPKAAIQLLDPVLKARPAWGYAHHLLGEAMLQLGDLPGAERELLAIAKANPASPEINTSLGRLYASKKNLARAREYFNKALELRPGHLLAVNGLIAADVVEKKPDAARRRVEALLATNGSDGDVLFMAGNTLMTLGDTGRAEGLFRKVLERDPANLDAYSRLGAIYTAQNRLEEAKKAYQAVPEGNEAAAATMVGMLFAMQNRHDEAHRQYELALSLDPNAPVAANNLAMALAESGESLDRALALAQKAKSQLPDRAEISDTLGWIYYKKGLAGTAISVLQEATKQAPNVADIHYHLGLAYLKNGETRQARSALQRALQLNPRFAAADEARRVLSTI